MDRPSPSTIHPMDNRKIWFLDRTCWAVVHGDYYITVILYLHRTPAYPNPWKSACYIMITVNRGSTSKIDLWNYLLSQFCANQVLIILAGSVCYFCCGKVMFSQASICLQGEWDRTYGRVPPGQVRWGTPPLDIRPGDPSASSIWW